MKNALITVGVIIAVLWAIPNIKWLLTPPPSPYSEANEDLRELLVEIGADPKTIK